MKGHLRHLAMCAPMLLVAAILLVGGANALVAILPVIGCVAMMGLMMWGMGHMHGHEHRHRGQERPTAR